MFGTPLQVAISPQHQLTLNRWTPLRNHAIQQQYWKSPHRFNIARAGRRSGKTELFKRKLVRRALETIRAWDCRFGVGAPTRDQAKRIYWEDLKRLVGRDLMLRPPSETELSIQLVNGNWIYVVGMDKPQRVEGSPWDGFGLDEYADMKPDAWPQNVRPMLSDRQGWCDFIGVPGGHNHYHELDTKALAAMKALGEKSEWGTYTWPSSDILEPGEIESAMRDLDELTFRQEYGGEFVSFEGLAYYAFDLNLHTAPLKYDDRQPLILCFDFNVAPGVCAIVQEQVLPNQYEHDALTGAPKLRFPIVGTGVIGEVWIPRNSNTPAVCRKIIQMFPDHKGRVECYGDATGGAEGSAKVAGSDWALIEQTLRPKYKDKLFVLHEASNPAERARVNSVNSRLRSTVGDVKLMVDGAKAPHVVKDFQGVVLLEGGSGEIDKAETPELTHLTDAIGYYVEQKFPVSGPGLYRVQVVGR